MDYLKCHDIKQFTHAHFVNQQMLNITSAQAIITVLIAKRFSSCMHKDLYVVR